MKINSALMIVVLGLVIAVLGCNSESREHKGAERNIIKEYVNTPKDKAREAGARLEEAQGKVRRQFEELEEGE